MDNFNASISLNLVLSAIQVDNSVEKNVKLMFLPMVGVWIVFYLHQVKSVTRKRVLCFAA